MRIKAIQKPNYNPYKYVAATFQIRCIYVPERRYNVFETYL